MTIQEVYLGDGLYVKDDGQMIVLRAPREQGDHWVGLDDYVLESLFNFIEYSRSVEITIEKRESDDE